MTSLEFANCLTVVTGVAIAFGIAQLASPGLGVTVGLLFVNIFIGLGLSFMLAAAYSYCIKSLYCPQTNDQNVWSLTFPIMAIPVYWLATLIGRAFGPVTGADEAQETASKKVAAGDVILFVLIAASLVGVVVLGWSSR